MEKTPTEQFALDVLKIAIEYEFTDTLMWNKDLTVAINCNDVFLPGADAEEIERDELLLLRSACEEDSEWGCLLFIAHKRKCAPMPNMKFLNYWKIPYESF